jgi:hypothetical protein
MVFIITDFDANDLMWALDLFVEFVLLFVLE